MLSAGLQRITTLLAAAVCSLFATVAVPQNQDFSYQIEAGAFRCLVQNIETYLQVSGMDGSFFAIDLCPEIPVNPVAASSINLAPDVEITEKDFDSLIFLLPGEIKCLENLAVPDEFVSVEFFPEQCSVSYVE